MVHHLQRRAIAERRQSGAARAIGGASVCSEQPMTALRRVLFVDELPRNTMGKVQKAALRQTYNDLYK